MKGRLTTEQVKALNPKAIWGYRVIEGFDYLIFPPRDYGDYYRSKRRFEENGEVWYNEFSVDHDFNALCALVENFACETPTIETPYAVEICNKDGAKINWKTGNIEVD